MKSYISILLMFLIYFQTFNLKAQTDTTDVFDLTLEELINIEIIGISKKAESLKESPMSVYVVTNEEMNRWQCKSLYDMLGKVPGYSFYNTDYYGQYGVVGRGMNLIWRYAMGFELMQIEDFGHFVFSPHFFKNAEVVRGPAGLMWGGSAEAGLVNFNIRDDLNGVETHAEIGNYNSMNYDVLYGKTINNENKDGFFVGFHYEKQDFEEADNTLGVFPTSFLPKIRKNGINPSWYVLSKYKNKGVKFMFFKDHSDHILPHMWDWNSSQQIRLIDTLEQKNGTLHDEFETTSLRGEYHFFPNRDNLDVFVYSSYYQRRWFINGLGSLTQRKNTVGFGINKTFLENKLNISMGGDLYSKDEANSPSENTAVAVFLGTNWWKDTYYPQKTEYSNLFLQADYLIIPKLKIILGGRLDYQKDAPKNEAIFSGPRGGLIYMPNDILTLKYLYNKTDRRPAGNEFSEGSQNALPENLNSHELVIMTEFKDKLSIDATLFQQQLNDRIFKVSSGSHSGWSNGGGLKCTGVEMAVKYKPINPLLIYLNGHYHKIEAIEKKVDTIIYSVDKFKDNRIPFVPAATMLFGAEYNVLEFIKLNVNLRANLKIPYYDLKGNESETNAYFVDLSLRSKKFYKDHFQLSLGCTNLLNNLEGVPAFGEHFNNSNGLIEPEGRRYTVKLQFNF